MGFILNLLQSVVDETPHGGIGVPYYNLISKTGILMSKDNYFLFEEAKQYAKTYLVCPMCTF